MKSKSKVNAKVSVPSIPPMVGRVLTDLRTLAGLTQKALAKRLGVSGAFVSMVETGRRIPPFRYLAWACEKVKVPTHVKALIEAGQHAEGPTRYASQLLVESFQKVKPAAKAAVKPAAKAAVKAPAKQKAKPAAQAPAKPHKAAKPKSVKSSSKRTH